MLGCSRCQKKHCLHLFLHAARSRNADNNVSNTRYGLMGQGAQQEARHSLLKYTGTTPNSVMNVSAWTYLFCLRMSEMSAISGCCTA